MQKENLTDHASCAIIALLMWAALGLLLEILRG